VHEYRAKNDHGRKLSGEPKKIGKVREKAIRRMMQHERVDDGLPTSLFELKAPNKPAPAGPSRQLDSAGSISS